MSEPRKTCVADALSLCGIAELLVIEGWRESPHRRDRHLCSQELVLGPRTWQEASENKTKVSRGENGRGVSLRRVTV